MWWILTWGVGMGASGAAAAIVGEWVVEARDMRIDRVQATDLRIDRVQARDMKVDRQTNVFIP